MDNKTARTKNKELGNNHGHFYYAYREAEVIRKKVIQKLDDKKWAPYNTEITDVLISPNNKLTYSVILKYTNGEEITLFDFMNINGINHSFFE